MADEVAPALPTPIDISMEKWRVYTYPDGGKFRISAPVELYLLEGGASHRVVSSDGSVHRPERGWVGISWLPREGSPPFIA